MLISFRTSDPSGMPYFKFHDLRHTFASSLARNNIDLYVVQRLLGHSSPKMTQRYAHLCEDTLKKAIEKIDGNIDDVMYNKSFRNSTILAHRVKRHDLQKKLCLRKQLKINGLSAFAPVAQLDRAPVYGVEISKNHKPLQLL